VGKGGIDGIEGRGRGGTLAGETLRDVLGLGPYQILFSNDIE